MAGTAQAAQPKTVERGVSRQYAGFRNFLRNYSRKDCGGLWVNRAVLQDRRGIMYFGGEGGLREFDGNSWRTIAVPNDWVSAMTIDKNGVIYLGGNSEFGFLAPDSRGRPHYKSLVQQLKPGEKDFTLIDVHATPEGIYFNGGKFLLRMETPSGNNTSTWKPLRTPDGEFDFSAYCGGTLFVQESGTGLKRMRNGTLELIPGAGPAADQRICMLVPFAAGKKLVGTRANKLYIFDGAGLAPFFTEAEAFLKENRFIHGLRLANGHFALATFLGGIVLVDNSGKIINILDKSTGLPNNLVNALYEDGQGNLWLGQEEGISMVEARSPISMAIEPPRFIKKVVKHQGNLYVSTESGVFTLNPEGKFRTVPGVGLNCGNIVSTGGGLLVATGKGILQVTGEGISKLSDALHTKTKVSVLDEKRIWIRTHFEFFSLYRQKRGWTGEHTIKQKYRFLGSFFEDRKGDLWSMIFDKYASRPGKAVLRIDVPEHPGSGGNPLVSRYGRSFGLTAGVDGLFKAAGHVVFSSRDGLFRFDEARNMFAPATGFGEQLTALVKKKSVREAVEDGAGNLWVLFKDGTLLEALLQPDGTYIIDAVPFLRLPAKLGITRVYPDPDGTVTWLYGRDVLVRFDKTVNKEYRHPFRCLIRKVTANGKPVFYGYPGDSLTSGGGQGSISTRPVPRVSYQDGHLEFQFAAPFFEGDASMRYRRLLDGHDRDWSGWTTVTQVSYNDLDPGSYRFRVQGRNIYGHTGREAVFSFVISLPWYRTWWAFLGYAWLFTILTYLVIKWRRSIQLGRDKLLLEKIVEERVEEVNRKNTQLEEQTLQLKEQSEKLKELDKLKSRFFANISHEFRTPLSLIMGPLEQMLAAESRETQKDGKKLTMMLRNAQRLLRLIDQLLELSRLESGNIKFQAYPQDIVAFLKGAVASFEPVAANNELELSLSAADDNLTLYYDPGKMEEIIFNLLSNAVKFTPAGGRVTVTVGREQGRGPHFPHGAVCISVSDTGPGIPREQMEHIFDRFFQADSTYEHHRKGSGIGLAIAKELVELHHGTIEARDGQKAGAEFTVRVPLGKWHLKPGDIVEPPEKTYPHGGPGEAAEPAEPAGHAAPSPGEHLPGPGKKSKDIILVVEDSADFRQYMKDALEPMYNVVTAADGDEGVKRAMEIVPDLVVSDVMMPGKDGYQLCRELKNHRETSHIPIVLLTARASERSIVNGFETGADDYVTKPFNANILLARIKNLVDQRRRLQVKRRTQISAKPREIEISSVDETFFKELEEVMEKHLSDPDFNIDRLKNKLLMGRTTLYRKITALTGLSPNRFIRTYRMRRAAQLLEANFGNVSEVALEVGFTNMAYFSQCFKEEFNQSPSLYQESKTGK